LSTLRELAAWFRCRVWAAWPVLQVRAGWVWVAGWAAGSRWWGLGREFTRAGLGQPVSRGEARAGGIRAGGTRAARLAQPVSRGRGAGSKGSGNMGSHNAGSHNAAGGEVSAVVLTRQDSDGQAPRGTRAQLSGSVDGDSGSGATRHGWHDAGSPTPAGTTWNTAKTPRRRSPRDNSRAAGGRHHSNPPTARKPQNRPTLPRSPARFLLREGTVTTFQDTKPPTFTRSSDT
jgi:hypothetical protein